MASAVKCFLSLYGSALWSQIFTQELPKAIRVPDFRTYVNEVSTKEASPNEHCKPPTRVCAPHEAKIRNRRTLDPRKFGCSRWVVLILDAHRKSKSENHRNRDSGRPFTFIGAGDFNRIKSSLWTIRSYPPAIESITETRFKYSYADLCNP